MRLMWVVLLLQIAATFGLSQEKALPTKTISAATSSPNVTNAEEITVRSTEETIVRTAYAKLAYADEVRIILDALNNISHDKLWKTKANAVDRELASRLNFDLSEFQGGKISDIADRKMSDFDGAPSAIGGEVLDVTPSVYNYADNGTPIGYVLYVKFAWKPAPRQILSPAETWSVAKAMRLEEFSSKKFTNYVTYTVTVTFSGKSRTYNAWMLFGRDEKGKPQVRFMDGVIDPTALTFAFEHSLFPVAFVKSDLHTVPFVDKWLYDNPLACNARSEKDDNRIDVCCDPGTGRCGIPESRLPSPISRRENKPARLVPASLHLPMLPVQPLMQAAGCSKFNVNPTFPHGLSDTQEHTTGQHTFTATVLGSCTYTDGAVSPGPCNVTCQAQSSSIISDAGTLGLLTSHATSKIDSSGNDFSNGGTAPVSCLGVSGGTVRSCGPFGCSTSVTVTAGGKGNLSASVVFPPSALWNDQNSGTVNCQPQSTAPTPTPTPPPPPPPPPPTPTPCDPGTPEDLRSGNPGDTNNPCASPIIIDTSGNGYRLTNAANGVLFDIAGTGTPMRLGWTQPGSGNAFLVLPGANGIVSTGQQLFGNFTPQPPSATPNGYAALAVYDQPDHGGNGDGVIDQKDEIFSSLRLWLDENHDGVCQPGELHRLPDLGVFSISLNYSLSHRVDEFGNVFRYRADVNPGVSGESDVGRKAFDVFLTSQ